MNMGAGEFIITKATGYLKLLILLYLLFAPMGVVPDDEICKKENDDLLDNGNCEFGVDTCKWDCKDVKGYNGAVCLEDNICYCCSEVCKNPYHLEPCHFDVETCKWNCSHLQYELAACIDDRCYCCEV